MSRRHQGVVTSSNALMCGNKGDNWGFVGQKNADGMLRQLAGPGLKYECDAVAPLAPGGLEKLAPNSAIATGAHGLNVRHIIHARAPTSAWPRESAEAALRRTYGRCLQLAAELEIASLALPALGCGVVGFPAAVGARAALDAIDDAAKIGLWSVEEGAASMAANCAARPSSRRIEFVLLDERVYAAFADAAHARWGG